SSLIERRYRNYLLPVRAEPASETVIDVDSITALARIADHTGAPMLQGRAGAYLVVDGARVYRYEVLALHAAGRQLTAQPPAGHAPPPPRRERPLRANRSVAP
ncbi:MAG: hypothetical protein QOH79_3490, partial [Acidimicrobiaceae bacterium]